MNDRAKYKIKNVKGAISCLLIFLAFITFNLSGSVDYFQTDFSDSVSLKDYHSSLEVDIPFNDFNHNPFKSPLEPSPEPSDSEEDTDGKDNLDEDSKWNKSSSFSGNSLSSILDSKSSQQRIKQLEESLANQRRISLFVLHHSWKNFIS